MMKSNCDSLQLNFLTSHSLQLDVEIQVMPSFSMSPWYSDIVYVLRNVQELAGLSKTRERSINLKSVKLSIPNEYLYWKDPRGILLNYLLEDEAQETIDEFHKGDYGGHHS